MRIHYIELSIRFVRYRTNISKAHSTYFILVFFSSAKLIIKVALVQVVIVFVIFIIQVVSSVCNF